MQSTRRTLKAWLRVGQFFSFLLLIAWAVGHVWFITFRPTATSGGVFVASGFVGVFGGSLPSGFRPGLCVGPPREPLRWATHSPIGVDVPGLFYVAAWLLLLIVGAPTFGLWRRNRQRPGPGFCGRCGYDLTGNTSGRCPECGAEARSQLPTSGLDSNSGDQAGRALPL